MVSHDVPIQFLLTLPPRMAAEFEALEVRKRAPVVCVLGFKRTTARLGRGHGQPADRSLAADGRGDSLAIG